jgi:hypothetical protein
MTLHLLQLSAQGDKIFQVYVGKNVGTWAKMWARGQKCGQMNVSGGCYLSFIRETAAVWPAQQW